MFVHIITWEHDHNYKLCMTLPFLVIIQYGYHQKAFFEYFHMVMMPSCPTAFFW